MNSCLNHSAYSELSIHMKGVLRNELISLYKYIQLLSTTSVIYIHFYTAHLFYYYNPYGYVIATVVFVRRDYSNSL